MSYEEIFKSIDGPTLPGEEEEFEIGDLFDPLPEEVAIDSDKVASMSTTTAVNPYHIPSTKQVINNSKLLQSITSYITKESKI